MEWSVTFMAVRLDGGLGATFSIINSVSAVTVAASLVAEHSNIPRSDSTMFINVKLPPKVKWRPGGKAAPSFCKGRDRQFNEGHEMNNVLGLIGWFLPFK